jgi:HSP20 family protein
MHTIINRLNHHRVPAAGPEPAYRLPHFDCTDLPSDLKIVLYVPGVAAGGIEITSSGPDLLVTATKVHHVRPNWQALHLEGVQRDYQLKLRLGTGFDYEALNATLSDAVLTIMLPKVRRAMADGPIRHRQVA